MTRTNDQPMNFDRREFLGAAGGFTLALTIAPERLSLVDEALADGPVSLNLWLTIDTDGTIRIVSPAARTN